MKSYYDLYLLGRLIKRLYFEGAGLFFANKENIKQSEKELSNDCELVNNKAYELCKKLQLNHLDIYWEQIFDTIKKNTKYNQKEFATKLNMIFQLIDYSINESLSIEESKFYQLGTFLSECWIYMVASKSFDMSQELESLQFEHNFKQKYKSLNDILNDILKLVHYGDISSFNTKIDSLTEEIKKIDEDRKTTNEKGGSVVYNIKGTNVQVGSDNTITTIKIEGMTLDELKQHLDKLDETEKKSFIEKIVKHPLFEHPLFTSILGGLAGGII